MVAISRPELTIFKNWRVEQSKGNAMSTDLRKHITGTYLSLRLGMALIAIFFPIVLWLGGVAEGQPLQESMSAYYFSGGGAMRDVFVGVLFAIGAFLYAYKGFNDLENIALNLQGCLSSAWQFSRRNGTAAVHVKK